MGVERIGKETVVTIEGVERIGKEAIVTQLKVWRGSERSL
jgi:thymidylate kinase